MQRLLQYGLCIGVTFAAVGPSRADDPYGVPSAAEVDAALAKLNSEQTRLAGLEKLISFAGYGDYKTGDAERDELIKKAADAVAKCRDFKTINRALHSSSETILRWGAHYFPWYPDDDHSPEDVDRWKTLLPRMRELAQGPDPTVRGLAQDALRHYEGQGEFLAECMKTETVAEHIMRWAYGDNGRRLHEVLNPHLLRLLGHQQEEVRRQTLAFVGFNSNRAPMWQIKFSDEVFARVLELSRSKSAKERSNAAYALADLRNRDPEAIRQRMFELAKDESADVRWHVPFALCDQLERVDVQAVMAQLLRDPSPLVRFFTIVKLGSQKHVAELAELAAGQDKQVAEFAKDQLKKLSLEGP